MDFDDTGRRRDGRELTYSEYINVPALLRSQRLPTELPRGRRREEWPERPQINDPTQPGATRTWTEGDRWPREWPYEELLFIITHQTFELWFRQLLHDLDDVLLHARDIVAKHGGTIPDNGLATRDSATAPPLHDALARYPQTAAVVARINAGHVWETRWVRELRAPGVLPGETAPQTHALRLEWFDDATLALFSRRIVRATRILRHATGAFDILGTMPPEEFLGFRSRLNPASGFGSTQFREIEISVGLKDMHRAKLASDGELSFLRHMPADEVTRMRGRMQEPSLRDLVYALLNAADVRGTHAEAAARADRVASRNLALLHDEFAGTLARFGEGSDVENSLHNRWRSIDEILVHAETSVLADMYTRPRARPGLHELLERCLDLDDTIRAWRTNHIPMVERIIGSRPGTGGGGISYLHTTMRNSRAFPTLWDFRSVLT